MCGRGQASSRVNRDIGGLSAGKQAADRSPRSGNATGGRWLTSQSRSGGQYSFLNAKKEPRMVPASLDFCLANLNRVRWRSCSECRVPPAP
jgi:hypothetical protein